MEKSDAAKKAGEIIRGSARSKAIPGSMGSGDAATGPTSAPGAPKSRPGSTKAAKSTTPGQSKSSGGKSSKTGVTGSVKNIGTSAATGAAGGDTLSKAVGGGVQGAVVSGVATALNKDNRRNLWKILAIALAPNLIGAALIGVLVLSLMTSWSSSDSASAAINSSSLRAAKASAGVDKTVVNTATGVASQTGVPWEILAAIKTNQTNQLGCSVSTSPASSSPSSSPTGNSTPTVSATPSASASSTPAPTASACATADTADYITNWQIPVRGMSAAEKAYVKASDRNAMTYVAKKLRIAVSKSKLTAGASNLSMDTGTVFSPTTNTRSVSQQAGAQDAATKVGTAWSTAIEAIGLGGIEPGGGQMIYQQALNWHLGNDSTATGLAGDGTQCVAPNTKSFTVTNSGSGGTLTMDATKINYAAQIIGAGKSSGITKNGQLVALMTALQETGLTMYANNTVPSSLSITHDQVVPAGVEYTHTVGLFMQKVNTDGSSYAWGTVAEAMDPYKSSLAFYGKLPGEQSGIGLVPQVPDYDSSTDLAQVAETIQRSGLSGDATYGRWTGAANTIWNALNGVQCSAGGSAGIGDGAAATCGDGNAHGMADGTLMYAGSCWFGGQGVPIYANGGNTFGTHWQCTELVRRFWKAKGWAPATWSGGVGATLWKTNTPAGAISEPQGSITQLSAGDVLSMEWTGGSATGHVGVVNYVKKTGPSTWTVQMASQNTPQAMWYFTWDGHSMTSQYAGFPVTGVMHHVGSGGQK